MSRIQKGLEQPHGKYSNQFPLANDQICQIILWTTYLSTKPMIQVLHILRLIYVHRVYAVAFGVFFIKGVLVREHLAQLKESHWKT